MVTSHGSGGGSWGGSYYSGTISTAPIVSEPVVSEYAEPIVTSSYDETPMYTESEYPVYEGGYPVESAAPAEYVDYGSSVVTEPIVPEAAAEAAPTPADPAGQVDASDAADSAPAPNNSIFNNNSDAGGGTNVFDNRPAGGNPAGEEGGGSIFDRPGAGDGGAGDGGGGLFSNPPAGEAGGGGGGNIFDNPPAGDSTRASTGSGTLIVRLPEDAKLIVNGRSTTSVGSTRQFVSNGLQAGLQYPYSLQATMTVNGREIVKTHELRLESGDLREVDFDFDVPVETQLTVRVPENAKLILAGSKTVSTGSERKFTTKRLMAGELWSNYKVVVTLEKDGKTITREQSIELRGGEQRTVTFDFDAATDQQLASR